MAAPAGKGKSGNNAVFNGLIEACEQHAQEANAVISMENKGIEEEIMRYKHLICSDQVSGALTKSTVGIMTEGTRVRDLLPRAPARLSKQIDIGDVILTVDNQTATTKDVLVLLRGSDQVGSQCVIKLQKPNGGEKTVTLTRMSTVLVYDIKVIFDNFAKILRHCLKGTTQDIPEVVNDTRIVWEMRLQAELEHEEELKLCTAKEQREHDRVTNELMFKLDMLHKGYYAEYQAWLNDRQSWLEREAEYLRRLGEKPAPVAAPAPAMVVDKPIPLNACVAVKPVRNQPRDLKSQLVTLDYEQEADKKPPVSGWGITYAPGGVIVEIYVTETTNWAKPAEVTSLLISDLAVSSGAVESDFSLIYVTNPDDESLLKPRIYSINIAGNMAGNIAGSHRQGYELFRDLAQQSKDPNSVLRKRPVTSYIKPFQGSSLPLPPSLRMEEEASYLRNNKDVIITHAVPRGMDTKAAPVNNMHKKAVQDSFALEFMATAGNEAFAIVSALTARHIPRDPRVSCVEAFDTAKVETWNPFVVSRDMGGEQKLKDLSVILKERGLLFEDPTFPAHNISLFADPGKANANANATQTFRKDQDPFLAGVEGIEWKRPSELGDPKFATKMFSGGIDPDDVAQGRLGNCYFLAAIANIATANKDLIINDLVVEDFAEMGMYGVKFFVNGQWLTVLVDDRIPCIPWGSQWMPIFAGLKDHSAQEKNVKELWPMIFEKAWAKLHMSYEVTAGGDTSDATNYLTGGLVTKMEIAIGNLQDASSGNANSCWDTLYKIMNPAEYVRPDGTVSESHLSFCSCNTRYDVDPELLANTGLISGHAYSILQMKKSEINGLRYIQVRNPWGCSEWNGDWSDKSPKWTDALKLEIGHEDEDDGTFWMSWEDFTTWFGDVQITDPTGAALATEGDFAQIDVYHSALVSCKTAGGPRKSSTYKFNPTATLKVTKDCEVELSMYQADTRALGLDEAGNQLDGQQLSVILLDPDMNESIAIDMSPFERLKCTKIYCVAGKSYKLTVCSWAVGVECPFWITAAGWGASLDACAFETPTGQEAEKMRRRTNQNFSCVACSQAFNGESYYPLAEGPTCAQCKADCGPKCTRCKKPLNGPYYSVGDTDVCVPCFEKPLPPSLPKGFNKSGNQYD